MIGEHRRRVAIIGGGLAGMAAAAALADAPLDVEIYEARRRPGGRAGSFVDPHSGQTVDYCQHVAMGCCTNLLHLLEWADLRSMFRRDSQLTFLAPGVPASRLAPSGWLPPPLHLAPAFSRLRFLTGQERRQVRRGLWRLMRQNRVTEGAASRETMGQWLRRRAGQSEATITKFWNVVLASALGDDVDRVAIGPARQVFVEGFLQARGAADLLVPREPLAEIFGRRLPERLDRQRVAIHHAARARHVRVRPDSRFEIDIEQREAVVADDVVVAVPWHTLPRLFKDSPLAAAIPRLDQISRIPGAPISGIHLWLDRPVMRLPHAVIVGRLSQWIFRDPRPHDGGRTHSDLEVHRDEVHGDEVHGTQVPSDNRRRRFAGDGRGHYYQVVVSAAHDIRGRRSSEIEAEVIADLRSVLPAARAAVALRSRIVTDPAAVFSVRPDVEPVRPATETAQRGLYLAGDWVQTGWPATMEGAVLSGYRAAEAICRRYGVPAGGIQPPLVGSRLARWLVA